MQFSQLILAAGAFAVASAAKFGMTPQQFVAVQVGQTFNISWYDGSGPATILLKNGPANLLTTYDTIASGQVGTSYQWSIPSDLPVDTYAFEIDDSTGTPNYSVQFIISGGPALSTSSTASATSTASSASTSGSTASLSTASSSSTGSASTTSTGSSTTSTGSASRTSSSTGSSSRTSTASTTSATTTPSAVNSASGISSPLALVLVAFAAFITLN